MIIYSKSDDILQIAQGYYASGLNLIPLKLDGSRSPKLKWGRYQERVYPFEYCRKWFDTLGPSGMAIVCGKTSGNLEVLDFDATWVFPDWAKTQDISLLARLPIVETPRGGRHVYYRCETIQGNIVLARKPDGKPLIETRGQGGYAVAPGSPLEVHESGKPYKVIQGELTSIPWITPEQRRAMFKAAAGFNQYVEPLSKPARTTNKLAAPTMSDNRQLLQDLFGITIEPELRPGDRFNRDAHWEDILFPHGWSIVSEHGEETYWGKPDGKANEHHATTNYKGSGLLKIFSTGAFPFEHESTYDKFAAFTLLNYGGLTPVHYKQALKAISKKPFFNLEE